MRAGLGLALAALGLAACGAAPATPTAPTAPAPAGRPLLVEFYSPT